MKKYKNVALSLLVFGVVFATNVKYIEAKPMPDNKTPVKVKVIGNDTLMPDGGLLDRLDILDGFNVDGSNYVKGRDLAEAGIHFAFNWNNDKKMVELVDESNNVILLSNKDLEDLGALQYNGENYFKVRTLLELALIDPQIEFDANTKVISYNNTNTWRETIKNTEEKIQAVENNDYSRETKEFMYGRIYNDLPNQYRYPYFYTEEEIAYIENNNIPELWQLAFYKKYKCELDEVRELMDIDMLLAGDKFFEMNKQLYYKYRPGLTEELQNEANNIENELKEYLPIPLSDVDYYTREDSGNIKSGQYYEYFKDAVKTGETTTSAVLGKPLEYTMFGNSSITINVNERFKRFVGNIDTPGVKIYGDGKLLHTSAKSDWREDFDVNISGVKKLKIENPTSSRAVLDDALLLRH